MKHILPLLLCTVLVATALACGALPAAAADDRTGPYAPYENLAEVLADFSRHLRDDLYRFPAPRDMLGRSQRRLFEFRVRGMGCHTAQIYHPDGRGIGRSQYRANVKGAAQTVQHNVHASMLRLSHFRRSSYPLCIDFSIGHSITLKGNSFGLDFS